MKTGTISCAFTLGTALSLWVAPAVAQSESGLSEIIVTAQRVEQRLQDVPISITVFSQEQLTRNNVTNAVDLANITPSLSVNNNFGNENASFAIRGFVQDAGTAPSVGTYFADVVAPRGPTQGTQAGDSAGPGSFFDLQNVQVLKGPQGTLFGRNTTGGAILLVPQKPTSKPEGYFEVSGGNHDMLRFQGAVNAPLSDSARFRIAVDHQKRDGWLHNVSGIGPSGYNDTNYTAVRASLVLDVTANIENYSILSYSKSDTNGSFEKLIAAKQAGFNPPDPKVGVPGFVSVFSASQLAAEAARGAGFWDAEASVTNPVSRIEQWQVINTTAWHASDTLTVKNIASYAVFTDFQRAPLFGNNWQLSTLPPVYQFLFGGAGIPSGLFETNPAPGLNSADQSTYTEEIQLQGATADQRLTYQGGVYFEWSDPLKPVGNQSAGIIRCVDVNTLNCTDVLGITFTALTAAQLAGFGVPPPYPSVNIGSVNYTVGQTTYRDRGIYAQSSYSITDQFKLTGGLRYTSDDQRNEATRITYRFPVQAPFTGGATASCTDPLAPADCSQFLEKKSSKPTWMIDFDYKPSEDMLLYAKYARGYRAGGVYSNAPSDHRIFNPEKVDNFELGLKTSFRGPAPGIFNVAAFYNNFSDQQLQIGFNPYVAPSGARAPVSPTASILNAGKSRIYGAEIEAGVSPLEGLNFDINYTYLKAEIRKLSTVTTADPNYVPDVADIGSGTPLVLSPEHKAVVTARYTLPLEKSIGAVSFGATYIYTSKQQANYTYLGRPALVAALGADYGIIPSHSLLNLDLAWNSIFGSGVDATAFATNVTNKQYYQYIPGLAENAGIEFAALGEPRMYGARLRYRFGK